MARHLCPAGEGVASMAEVSTWTPVDAVPAPVVERGFAGPSAPPGMITARGPVSLPRGFPRVNPLAPDAMLLL